MHNRRGFGKQFRERSVLGRQDRIVERAFRPVARVSADKKDGAASEARGRFGARPGVTLLPASP